MDGSLPDILDYLSCPEDVTARYSFADVTLAGNSDKANGTFCRVDNELFSADENREGHMVARWL